MTTTEPVTSMRSPRQAAGRAAVVVWVWAGAAIGLNVYETWSSVASGDVGPNGTASGISWSLVLVIFTVAGALIVSRQPRNIIGWLLMITGVASILTAITSGWLESLQPPPQTMTPLIWLALWFDSWSWVLLIFPVFHLMLTFPTGRLQSPRWRWVAGLEAAMLVTFLSLVGLSETMELFVDDAVLWTVHNPIGFLHDNFWDNQFGPVWGILLLVLTIGCVGAMVQRFRKAGSVEREQMKWLMLAVGFFGVVYGTLAVINGDEPLGWIDVLFALSLASIPVAIAIAVLRYRLYDIDRLLSRTVSYTVVVGLLAALFFGTISVLTSLLPAPGDVTIAASTLAVFALFNPLRRRVQNAVDRRFNRSRYDSRRVMDHFADTLRDQLDANQVVEGWVGVVSETMQPVSVGLWLRSG
jgi:hypothetical protein